MTPCCTASLQMSRKFFLLMALAFLRVTLGWLYGSECSSTTSFSHAIDVRRISRIRNRVRSRKVARIKTSTRKYVCGSLEYVLSYLRSAMSWTAIRRRQCRIA